MPATATRNQGKTLFVKETLIDHPTANPKFVNEAWKQAGYGWNDQRDPGQQDEGSAQTERQLAGQAVVKQEGRPADVAADIFG